MSGAFHFIAIGGIGQSALAKILLQKGVKVSGSDIYDSKYLKELRDLGAEIFIGHDAKNVPGGNVKIVLSTAIKEDNPEFVEAKRRGLEILHRSDVLKIISEGYSDFIGFSGTHGKTTTSGLCAYVLSKIGAAPGFAIGGIIPEIGSNGGVGASSYGEMSERQESADCLPERMNHNGRSPRYFVAELDESDGTILKYCPSLTVINNLESDHFDFFEGGLEQVFDVFAQFVEGLSDDAKILLNIDDAGNREFIGRHLQIGKFSTFSTTRPATYEARDITYSSSGSKFNFYFEGEKLGEVSLIIPGAHNVYNAVAVAGALIELGFDFKTFAPHFSTFTGMGRRFQLVEEFDGIKIIDDYAHHPTEILATLEAAKKYSEGRVVAIFQPHRYTRFHGLWEEFLGAFENADLLIVLDVYKAGETPIKGFDSDDFIAQIKHDNVVRIKGDINTSAKEILPLLKPQDTVLTLGAGDITKMGEALNEVRCPA